MIVFDNLPREVVADILLRLPDKTLGYCLCVCKSWYTFITSPTFITKHFHKRKINGRRLLFRQFSASNGVCYSLHLDNSSFVKCQDLDFPLQSFRGNLRIVGSCNGLLCLSETMCITTCNIFLWNPTIQKFLSLPPPPVSFSHYSTHVYDLGFGFDCLSDDYKVVMPWIPKPEHGNVPPTGPQIFVYSLSTNSWRNISAVTLSFKVVRFHMTQAFVNGAIHWVASGRINRLADEFHSDFILRFNVSDERFDKMCLPKCCATNGRWKLLASSLHKRLSAARYDRERLHFDCSIWTMKEYGVSESWTKPIMVSLGPIGRNTRWTCVLGSRGNGDLIFVGAGNNLFSYEFLSGRSTRYLQIYDSECSFYLDNFTESLALLGQGKKILKKSVAERLVLVSQVSKNLEEDNNQSKPRKKSGRNATRFLRKFINLIQKGCNRQGYEQEKMMVRCYKVASKD